MRYTYGDIEDKVRLLVNDTEEPKRFASDSIWGFTVDAVRQLRRICPSERYGEDGLLDDSLPVPEDADDTVRIDERHEEAVIKYAAHLIYQLDMTDTVNMQIAEALRTRAEALMQL